MKVSSISLSNVKGYRNSGDILFSERINILVGANNSGKTTILKSILLLQNYQMNDDDVTIGGVTAHVKVGLNDVGEKLQHGRHIKELTFSYKKGVEPVNRVVYNNNTSQTVFRSFPSKEPDNVIYPYLSKRKVVSYSEDVRMDSTNSVFGNFSNLYAKVDRISNQDFQPANSDYRQACHDIIGFPVSSVSSASGKKAALIVRNLDHIPLDAMGEGVVNMLGLIVDLCVSEGKIFLIEEPENDIHPRALKALLQLIERRSKNNQFFISTHSNIVTKYLGGVNDAKIFNVTTSFAENSRLPQSSIAEVENSTEARRQVLEDLGYEFHDYDLWKGWLFLEESSAEELIRDIIIPVFMPKLKTILRTYSARSVDEIEVKFKDFNNLFVFLHLSPTYKNKAWVLVDGGDKEKDIIDQMKSYYVTTHGWSDNNFSQFSEHSFERYYPQEFKEQIDKVLAITDRKQRNVAKSNLLKVVKQWCLDNPKEAKESLAISAKEVIDFLKNISKQIE